MEDKVVFVVLQEEKTNDEKKDQEFTLYKKNSCRQ